MKKIIAAFLFSTALVSAGCKKESDTVVATQEVENTAIKVSENGAAPYLLQGGKITQASYASSTAALQVGGKLNDGTYLSLNFEQNTREAGKTDALTATLGNAEATRASGTTVRDAAKNTVSGSFSATFPNGKVITGTLTEAKLP